MFFWPLKKIGHPMTMRIRRDLFSIYPVINIVMKREVGRHVASDRKRRISSM